MKPPVGTAFIDSVFPYYSTLPEATIEKGFWDYPSGDPFLPAPEQLERQPGTRIKLHHVDPA